jgi:hypothetical protein
MKGVLFRVRAHFADEVTTPSAFATFLASSINDG